MIFLLLCAIFFAFYHSNSAYTSDEVWSIAAVAHDYQTAMEVLKADVHPPLYYQVLHVWIRVFGTSERAARSLSALFYLMSVLAVYRMGLRLYGEKTAALCAAIYLSSPLTILSAQFVRMYSLLSLLSILSTSLFFQLSKRPQKSKLVFALFVIVNILGTFTHIAFFFLLFAEIVFHVLFNRRDKLTTFLLLITCSVVPYLIFWGPVLLKQVTQSREGLAWVPKPTLGSLGELLVLYGGALWLLVPVLIYVWWRTGFKSVGTFSKLDRKAFSLWMMAVTLGTPLLISIAKPIFNARLAIVGIHLFALVIAGFIGQRANYGMAAALVGLTFVGVLFLHPASAPCDNRAVADYLTRTTRDEDAVIFTSLTRLPIDYYLQQVNPHRKFFETSYPAEIDQHPGYEGRITDPTRKQLFVNEAKDLSARLSQTNVTGDRKVFVFRGLHPEIDSIIDSALREHFEVIPDHEFNCAEPSPYFNSIAVYRRSK